MGDVLLRDPWFHRIDGTLIENTAVEDEFVLIRARSASVRAGCPDCGVVPQQVHSRHLHRPADSAVAGRPVVIGLHVRRFRCGERARPRTTFTEQIEGLTFRPPSAKLRAEQGASVSSRDAGGPGRLATGQSTEGQDEPAVAPSIHRPADPWRRVANWLKDHSGVEVICRRGQAPQPGHRAPAARHLIPIRITSPSSSADTTATSGVARNSNSSRHSMTSFTTRHRQPSPGRSRLFSGNLRRANTEINSHTE